MAHFGKIKQCVKCDSVVHYKYNVCPSCGATQSKRAERSEKELRQKFEPPSKGKNNK
jgi:rRNA maturation endonuclease Nob1